MHIAVDGADGRSRDEWTLERVKDYYGKVLGTKHDLKTTACCSTESLPAHVKPILELLHEEVLERFYGCGAPMPHELAGLTVLDLGCGAGRDAFILSKLVGEEGRVIGVDMTAEQLEVANRLQGYHADKFGYSESNIDFRHGYIEDLESAGVPDGSVDLVVSNCVFNLSPNKQQLFREVFRVLKPGGELYFSDVFASRRMKPEHASDPVLLGECIGNALYIEDFRRQLLALGIRDYRMMSSRPITLTDSVIKAKVGHIEFRSITIRAFKLDLEDRCEDFGQSVSYRGTMAECPTAFVLDDHHIFEKGRLVSVCGNSASMVMRSRFGRHFDLHGSGETHYGLFPCGPGPASPLLPDQGGGCC